MNRCHNQVVSATVQNVMRVGVLLTESRRGWGGLARGHGSKAEL